MMTENFYAELKSFGAAYCGPVQYTPGGFAVSAARLIDPTALENADAARLLTDHVMSHHHDLWALKLSDWDTEYEYRFVCFVPEVPLGEPIHVPFAGCLRAIILGDLFDDALVAPARELAQTLGVALCRLEWDTGRVQ